MKNLLSLFLLTFSFFTLHGQNIPVDFETTGHGASWNWTTFENDSNPALEIVENPDVSGINTSSTVAKFTALQAGAPFAGCETLHGAGIGSFTIDESTKTINIMVWKSVISDIGIKLVREDNWSLGEIKIANTLINQWEQITFDFSAHLGLPYDQLVIFPDFDTRSADNVIYFDNVFGADATMTGLEDLAPHTLNIYPNPAQTNLTINAAEHIEEIKIYSLSGVEILSKQEVEKACTLDIAHLERGAYILKMTINGRQIVDKLIKS